MWDAVVLGSGMGGLATAAALARRGRKVLVLEQHQQIGGQTQTFQRQGWTFATGVHYLGGVGPQAGPGGQFGRLLAWLSGGTLRFAPCANPYDVVRLPGFAFGIEHPESRFRAALARRFPAENAGIDAWFQAAADARGAAVRLLAQHAMPPWLAWVQQRLYGRQDEPWRRQTVAQALVGIRDPLLRAVLAARWGDHGAPPAQAPFVEHALVTGAYNDGAYFPVGGPAQFAQALRPVVESAGGAFRTGALVSEILLRDGHARGVRFLANGRHEEAPARCVVSAMGVLNTVGCLPPAVAREWQGEVRAIEPGVSFVSLYIGLEGDIAAAGASSANHWIYASEDIGRLWRGPGEEEAPALFVSFPSLKDPQWQGPPTAEVLALVDRAAFAHWLRPHGQPLPPEADPRDSDYTDFKAVAGERLLAQFKRHFPALAPMVRFHEVATPLTQRRLARTPEGAMYGLAMNVERLASPALRVKTPVRGLLLAGQDVAGAGVQAACVSGVMAAATVEPDLWRALRV